MVRCLGNIAPFEREYIPSFRHPIEWRRAASALPRDGDQTGKPAIEPFCISAEHMRPPQNARIGVVAVKKLLHGLVSHEAVWLGKIWQEAYRASAFPAAKPPNENEEHQSREYGTQTTGVISQGFHPAKGPAMTTRFWRGDGLVRCSGDVIFRGSFKHEDHLHVINSTHARRYPSIDMDCFDSDEAMANLQQGE